MQSNRFNGPFKYHTILLRIKTKVLFRTTISFLGQETTVFFRTKQPLKFNEAMMVSKPATLRIGDSERILSVIFGFSLKNMSKIRLFVFMTYFIYVWKN